MRVLQAQGRLTNIVTGQRHRQWPLLTDQAVQIDAFHVLHGDYTSSSAAT